MRITRLSFAAPIFSTLLFCFCLCACQYRQEKNLYTLEDYSDVPKVDVHVHINTEDPALLEQAKEDNFYLLTINVDVPDYPPIAQQMEYALRQKEVYPDRVFFLSTFGTDSLYEHHWEQEALALLENSLAKGSKGVKVWKNIGMVLKKPDGAFLQIDDAAFDPVFNFLAENKVPVCGHIGEPRNCWLPLEEMTVNNDRNYYERHPEYHMYQHPDYPSHEDLVAARDRLLEKHPNMKFVGTHLGSMEWSVDEIAQRLDKYPNLAVDLTARISHLQYQSLTNWAKVRDFMIHYQDRIMYGTDLHITREHKADQVKVNAHQTWLRDWQYLVTEDSMQNNLVNGRFKGLALPREVVDKIYFHNANQWYALGL
ncbi:MAG TPA: amidohydrolase family protein [Cyclobacteriaceae bacterium]|nr:amidohydrolase family protein [Cyclobacteriaceae bacterium]